MRLCPNIVQRPPDRVASLTSTVWDILLAIYRCTLSEKVMDEMPSIISLVASPSKSSNSSSYGLAPPD
ncbi:hypothetical protein ES319_A11G269600v1 [Gossypium barbadense]|uniref:Uncharacterized protein n=2 Tax=Gossypium TaxID=3633 RepID=A0A5J5TT75_GOSBA|nr:hypothetical protein ES319_A11G269600v1 [Gossypium barbadense]TYG95772.1 hypothetical protein ES288_A11G294600v1 [Gossypium darwinii]